MIHLEIRVFPIEGGKWGVMAYLLDEDGKTIDGAGPLDNDAMPTTWADVFHRVDELLRDAEWRGFPVRMRTAHDDMLRKTGASE